MILTGKDLAAYRFNKIAKFALMAAGTLMFTLCMALMCIAFC
jgi:hypothetical protein